MRELTSPDVVRLQDRHEVEWLATEAGLSLIQDEMICVVLLAGGQGRRLGFDGPKCLYPICGKTIIQHQLEKIPPGIKSFVMSSIDNRRKIEDSVNGMATVFSQDETFEYNKMSVQSGTKHPDGHGGFLSAFMRASTANQSIGRKIVFVCQADNPLAPVCSPLLIGLHYITRSQATAIVVEKKSSEEKMGAAARCGDRNVIVEYGTPGVNFENLKWGNTGIYVFDGEFLQSLGVDGNYDDVLRFHLRPQPDGSFRREKFIFDLIPMAKRSQFAEMDRDTVFAPVKDQATADEASRLVAALW